MALADICGINKIVNFNKADESDKLDHEIDQYSHNFFNNMSLARALFVNVSIKMNF